MTTTPAEGSTTEGSTPPEGSAPKQIDWSQVPDSFKFLEKLYNEKNSESARLRTERNELREKLSTAKTPEEFATLQKENEALRIDGLRREAASKHGVPEDLVEFLTATDAATLEAQAAKLAAKAPATPTATVTRTAPRGGTDPSVNVVPDKTGKDLWKTYKERGTVHSGVDVRE